MWGRNHINWLTFLSSLKTYSFWCCSLFSSPFCVKKNRTTGYTTTQTHPPLSYIPQWYLACHIPSQLLEAVLIRETFTLSLFCSHESLTFPSWTRKSWTGRVGAINFWPNQGGQLETENGEEILLIKWKMIWNDFNMEQFNFWVYYFYFKKNCGNVFLRLFTVFSTLLWYWKAISKISNSNNWLWYVHKMNRGTFNLAVSNIQIHVLCIFTHEALEKL